MAAQNEIGKTKIFFKTLLIAIAATRLWTISLYYLFGNNKEIIERIVNDSFHHYQVGILLIAASYALRKTFRPEVVSAIGLGIFLEEWPVFFNDLGLKTNNLYHSKLDFMLIFGLVAFIYVLLLWRAKRELVEIVKNEL